MSSDAIEQQTQIVSCRTLEIELERAMANLGVEYPVFYTDSELHNTPDKLRGIIQTALDGLFCQRLIIAMGSCGGALAGLTTGDFETIVPRVDDCVSLLLGLKRKQELIDEAPTYFLTQGWLNSSKNIWVEYCYCIGKYGLETGEEIFDLMFNNYKRLGVIDAGCYDVNTILGETEKIATALKLEHQVLHTDVSYIERLLAGPWDPGEFLRIPPHTTITPNDLRLPTV